MHSSNRARRLAALALAPTLVFAVGCGKAAEKIGEKAAEKAIENAVDGNANVDVGSDGKIKIETEDGSYQTDGEGNLVIETEDGTFTSGQGLPDGWPDDVPIPDGTTVGYGSSSPDGLAVTLQSTRSAAELYDDLKASLDGWTVEDEYKVDADTGDMRSARFIDGERSVSVTAMENDEGESSLILNYSTTAS